MLTVRDSTVDKVRALDLGADDYLTKPFDHIELLARLRALMRRAGNSAQALPYQGDRSSSRSEPSVDVLHMDFELRDVHLHGKPVSLTSVEYRLLEELVRHAGKVMPHEMLLERVWGPAYVGDVHYLKVFVQRLRRKLGDGAEQPHYIRTEWGVGYQFVGEASISH